LYWGKSKLECFQSQNKEQASKNQPSLRYLELLLVAVLVLLVLLSSTLRSIDVEQVLLSLLGLDQPLPNLLSLDSHLHIMLVRITTGV